MKETYIYMKEKITIFPWMLWSKELWTQPRLSVHKEKCFSASIRSPTRTKVGLKAKKLQAYIQIPIVEWNKTSSHKIEIKPKNQSIYIIPQWSQVQPSQWRIAVEKQVQKSQHKQLEKIWNNLSKNTQIENKISKKC